MSRKYAPLKPTFKVVLTYTVVVMASENRSDLVFNKKEPVLLRRRQFPSVK